MKSVTCPFADQVDAAGICPNLPGDVKKFYEMILMDFHANNKIILWLHVKISSESRSVRNSTRRVLLHSWLLVFHFILVTSNSGFPSKKIRNSDLGQYSVVVLVHAVTHHWYICIAWESHLLNVNVILFTNCYTIRLGMYKCKTRRHTIILKPLNMIWPRNILTRFALPTSWWILA